ncbi:glutathione S-transferase family protein [Halopseudomonas pelagia]|uniref:glutathione S-transferase family protein n=1 Tax=Halopseudomonas pelagia TaxID=553151 RepID=UPI0003A6C9AD|nr:glutathione S-transferase family protein [Halopseudomonas pelagia]
MALTLYGAILSPFVRKIRIQLGEQNIAHAHVPVPPMQQPDWYYAISPLGRIPAIQDGEVALADSAVIAQYLHETYPGSTLYGHNSAEAARVRWLEKYADYELAAYATFTVFSQRFLEPLKGGHTDEEAVQAALHDQLPPLFDYLERELGEQRYFLGETFSMADIAVVCQLINLAHVGALIDEQRWPGLASLLSRATGRSTISGLLPAEHQLVAKYTARRQAPA